MAICCEAMAESHRVDRAWTTCQSRPCTAPRKTLSETPTKPVCGRHAAGAVVLSTYLELSFSKTPPCAQQLRRQAGKLASWQAGIGMANGAAKGWRQGEHSRRRGGGRGHGMERRGRRTGGRGHGIGGGGGEGDSHQPGTLRALESRLNGLLNHTPAAARGRRRRRRGRGGRRGRRGGVGGGRV